MKRKKLTKEDFIERSNKIYNNKYDYSEVDFVNGSTKVKIICPIHGPFWLIPNDHVRGCGCKKCGIERRALVRTMPKEEFIRRASELYNDKYDYSKIEYKNLRSYLTIICPIHGEFVQLADHHLLGHLCPVCAYLERSIPTKLSTEQFIEKAREVHGDKYDYSKVNYIDTDTKVEIICPEHGSFWLTPHSHLGGSGCIKCAKLYSMTNEEFIEVAKTKYCGYYTFEHTNFISYAHKVTITCPKHGDFEVWPQNFLKEKSGCPKCKYKTQHSIYEKICNAFPQLNIIYETGKVDWLQGLRFDIYIPELNIAIEYDGEQHFVPVEKFGGEIALKETQKRDRLKEELCDQNNCILIRISCYNKEDGLNLCLKIIALKLLERAEKKGEKDGE